MERCFDLARSIEAHLHSAGPTGERVVAGRSEGLIGLDDTVTWRARHLGATRTLTVRITRFDRPVHFRDSQVQGAFAWFDHDHWFEADGDAATLARERFTFAVPWWLLGGLTERLVVGPHMKAFLARRAQVLKGLAEGDGWRRFLGETLEAHIP